MQIKPNRAPPHKLASSGRQGRVRGMSRSQVHANAVKIPCVTETSGRGSSRSGLMMFTRQRDEGRSTLDFNASRQR